MSWISIPQLSKMTGLTENMIRDMVDAGLLQTFQNKAALQKGKRAKHLIAAEDLKAWLETTMRYSPEKIQTILCKLFPNRLGQEL